MELDTSATQPLEKAVTGIPSELQQRILEERLRLLHAHLLTASFPGTVLCSTVVLAILFNTNKHQEVIIWYVLSWLIVLIRTSFLVIYHHTPHHNYLHFTLFLIGTWFAAAMWGLAGTALMPVGNVLHQASLIIIIAGMSAGSTQSLQPSRFASMSYVMIAITPLFVWLTLQTFKPYLFLSISIFTFVLFMLITSNRGFNVIIETLKLRYEKTILADELTHATEILKLTNQTLTKEVKERKKIAEELHYLATHDTLTNLYNRDYLNKGFKQELLLAQQNQQKLGVLYLDLDGFKSINDKYGHPVGDKLLIEVSSRLTHNIRSNDIAARLGGDEFLIILAAISDLHTVSNIAKELLQKLKQPFLIESHEISISASVGISIYPTDGDNESLLIKNADLSLYQAKISGKNAFKFYRDTAT